MTDYQDYVQMVNATLDGLTLIDKNFRYLIVNEAYLKVKNIEREKIVGKTVEDIWGKIIFNQNIKPHLDRAFSGHVVSYQIWIDFTETDRKFMEVTYWPCFLEGQVNRVVVNSHDITELKLTEMELQKNLRISDHALSVKSSFLANMSHEIRTPLHAILSMVEFLRADEISASARDHLDTLKNCSTQLLHVVNDILDFSKIEEGKMQLEIIKFNLKSSLREVYGLMLMHAMKKNIKLSCEIDSRIPNILWGDPSRIKQVLINLLSNAIKFTPANGEIELIAKVIYGRHDSFGVQFMVRDNGRGMEPTQRQSLLKWLEQGGEQKEGLGVGLPICQHFVKLMGGELEIESEFDKGSCFQFHIPMEVGEDQGQPSGEEGSKKLRIVHYGKLPESIVEHSKNWNYQWVSYVENMLFNKQDLFLVSILRDELSYDILKALPLGEIGKTSAIMVITQAGKKGESAMLQELGVHAYLSEPYSMDLFKTALQKVKIGGEWITKHSLNDANYDRRKRVLVVEDNPTNQKILVKHLQNFGLELEVANNGQEACDVTLKNNYDFIFMDIRMPVMDGFEATLQIRKNPLYHNVPIVALTADAVPEAKARALEVGMQDFMAKPFTKDQIRQCIEKYLYG